MLYDLRYMPTVKDIRLFMKQVQDSSALTVWAKPEDNQVSLISLFKHTDYFCLHRNCAVRGL